MNNFARLLKAHLVFHLLNDLLQAADDASLLLDSAPWDPQVLLEIVVFILEPLDLINESEIVLLQSLEQLYNLRVAVSSLLIEDFLLEFLILLSEHFHVVLEKIDIFTHPCDLLLVLLDTTIMLLTLSVHLLLKGIILGRGQVGLGQRIRTILVIVG